MKIGGGGGVHCFKGNDDTEQINPSYLLFLSRVGEAEGDSGTSGSEGSWSDAIFCDVDDCVSGEAAEFPSVSSLWNKDLCSHTCYHYEVSMFTLVVQAPMKTGLPMVKRT